MSEPLISILIPVYNASLYIEKCATSVFLQSYQNIEFIFVDDGSLDDSVLILQKTIDKFPARKNQVTILSSKENKGISAARQKAFNHAKGLYWLAMDSDDYIESNMIKLLVEKAIESQADIIYCDYFSERPGQTKICRTPYQDDRLKLMEYAVMGHSAYWNKLIKRDLLIKNNIHTLENIDHGDDLAVIIKLLYFTNKTTYVPIPLYHYVEMNFNSTTKKFKPKYIEDRLLLVQNIEMFLNSVKDAEKFEKLIILLKSIRKVRLIRLSRGDARWNKLYPEINSKLIGISLPFSSRLILALSQFQLNFLLKLWLR
jgi:glycosyltransferase involved in cell wall biosynthesis